ncbi:hypothetical protein HW132_34800 [Brasilonema sp. CT11]|nr:hypothetical protein [Brasilonema sp. CT11]
MFSNTQDEILFKGFVEACGVKVEADKSNLKKPPKFSKRVVVITKYRIAVFKKGMFNKLSVILILTMENNFLTDLMLIVSKRSRITRFKGDRKDK